MKEERGEKGAKRARTVIDYAPDEKVRPAVKRGEIKQSFNIVIQ
jgi:hypothetical protein